MKRWKGYITKAIIGFVVIISIGCEDKSDNLFEQALGFFHNSIKTSSSNYAVKAIPETITILSSTNTQAETQATEDAQENKTIEDPARIWDLFDSNTSSSYIVSKPHRFNLSFGREIELKRMKIYGSTACTVNIYTGSVSNLIKIPSLCIDHSILKDDSWNTLNADETISTDSVVLEIIPDGESGIQELEFWSEEAVTLADGSVNSNLENAKSYEDLKASVEKCNPHVIEKNALPNEISISGTQEERAVGQFHVSLTINPLIYKRAFIKYKAKNILASVGIERCINNLSWNGGYDIPVKEGATPSTDWIEYFEEINPSWLVPGDNIVEFRTNKSDVSIQGLSLVLVMDNGWNQVITSSKPEAYDNDEATTSEIASIEDSLDVEFERMIEPESITLSLEKKTTARLSIQYLSNGQWVPIKTDWTVDLSKMNPGWNTITLPTQVQTSLLRLQIDAAGWSDAESKKVSINELRVCGSPAGNLNIRPRIIVSYPRNGEYYGRTAFIQGFVSSTYPASIGVENRTANQTVQDNSFSLPLSKDDTRFSGQEDDTAWEPIARAARLEYSVNTTIPLTRNLLSTSSGSSGTTPGGTPGGNNPGNSTGYTTEVSPDSAKTITYGPITITIPAGAVDEKITISIIPLTKSEVAGLNPGMINVTYPAAGYRFLVNGKPHYNFRKTINISFTYSKTLLLKGQNDNDVFMYYYDEKVKIWKRLKRISISDKQTIANTPSSSSNIVVSSKNSYQSSSSLGFVTSETNHFTDIIESTITVPEQPDPLLYNPNTIKDIKVGHPSEEINLISPPNPSSKGDANLSYPIELPQGRCGMQPKIAVVYNSSNTNGWLGIGWDIPIHAVSYDTSFGVPRYDAAYSEYDRFLLEGEQIVPIGNGQFQTRVEGSFKKIIRRGTDYTNYYWEVTDKNGTKYIYGQHDNSRLKSYKTPGNISTWCLERIQDTNGNTINYSYISDNINDTTKEPSTQIYLDKITYTGTGTNDGPFSVVFIRDALKPGTNSNGEQIFIPNRPDVIVNCRGGFKVVTRYRLESIDVLYNNNKVRSYAFSYETGVFSKSRLTKIDQLGSDGRVFNTHSFTYYNDVASNDSNIICGFDGNEIPISNANGNHLRLGNINHTTGGFLSSEIFLGVSWGGKSRSVGCVAGSSKSKGDSKMQLIDIDGDGLPDQVYVSNDGVYYRKNMGYLSSSNQITFNSNTIRINFLSDNLDTIGRSTTSTDTFGIQASWNDFTVVDDILESTSTIDTYFIDVNGDGLIDVVKTVDKESIVYYNYGLDRQGNLIFNGTPPSGFKSWQNTLDLTGINAFEPQRDQQIENYHREDPILMWEAPYNGVIHISGDVTLLQNSQLKNGNEAYSTNDGVKVSIQKGNNLLWSSVIGANEHTPVTPANIDDIPVNKGDQIYFRVNSIYDGAFDVVDWNPLVEYKGVDTSEVDENLVPIYKFNAQTDFSIAGAGESQLPLLSGGRFKIEGTFSKGGFPTSDDITIKIFRKDENGTLIAQDITQIINGDDLGNVEINTPEIEVGSSDSQQVVCELSSNTPIDWSKISFRPKLTYTYLENMNVQDANGNYHYVNELPVNIAIFTQQNIEAVTPYKPVKAGNVRIIYAVTPLTNSTLPMETNYYANYYIAIKNNGKLIRKEHGVITPLQNNGVLIDFTTNLTMSDNYSFVFVSDQSDYRTYLQPGLPTIYYESDNGLDNDNQIKTTNGIDCYDVVYLPRNTQIPFAGGNRSWFFGRWNGENDILDPSKMTSPGNEDLNNLNNIENMSEDEISELAMSLGAKMNSFSAMQLKGNDVIAVNDTEFVWTGLDNDCWIGRVKVPNDPSHTMFSFSSTRFQKKYIPLDNETTAVISSGGVPKIVRTETTKINGSQSIIHKRGVFKCDYNSTLSTTLAALKVVGGISQSLSISVLDFLDFNGDKYPDIVEVMDLQDDVLQNGIQFTRTDGSLDDNPTQIESLDLSTTGGNSTLIDFSIGHKSNYYETTSTKRQWGNISNAKDFGFALKALSTDQPKKVYTTDISQQSGASIETVKHIDVNGDGLPDVVLVVQNSDKTNTIRVKYNLGYDFGDVEDLIDGNSYQKTKIGIGGGTVNCHNSKYGSHGWSAGINHENDTMEMGYIDINGDWLPDFVEKNKTTNKMYVRFNTGSGYTVDRYEWQNTNLLYDISSSHTINEDFSAFATGTYLHWIISGSVQTGLSTSTSKNIFQDIDGDGTPDQIISHENGDFTAIINKTGKTNLLKSVNRPLGSSFQLNYKREGNTTNMPQSRWTLSQVIVNDGLGNNYESDYSYSNGYYDRTERLFYGFGQIIETRPDESTITHDYSINSYYTKGLEYQTQLRDDNGKLYLATNNEFQSKPLADKIQYTYLVSTLTQYHEGNDKVSKNNMQSYDYDQYGNITKYVDTGDNSGYNMLTANISYTYNTGLYIVGKPNQIIVVGGDGKTYRKRVCEYDISNGNLKYVSHYSNDATAATTTLDYYPNGNIHRITAPGNNSGQSYWREYTYDSNTNTQIVSIKDAFGYESTMINDLRYGKPISKTDINGNTTTFTYDPFGRISTIYGPYDIGSGTPTYQISYNINAIPAVAKSSNKSYQDSSQTIDVFTYVDGLKRVIQTKKTSEVEGSNCITSGAVVFDKMGRVYQQGQPVKGILGMQYASSPMKNATIYNYDVLGRQVMITYPDGTTNKFNYGITDDNNYFYCQVLDQLGWVKYTITDIRGKIKSIKEGLSITTQYSYNSIGEITSIRDAKGNTTAIVYDMMGRRTSIDNPDTGQVDYTYDAAGNVTSKSTPNLRNAGIYISYDYYFDRLRRINYPNMGTVTYTYGDPGGGATNTAGRISHIENGTIIEDREYGKLGELTKCTRSIHVSVPTDSWKSYSTYYEYDTMGRMQSLTFHDGEKIKYAYNVGGLLKGVISHTTGKVYIKDITYNEFDQRTKIEYGNDAITKYSYDTTMNRLESLTTTLNGQILQNITYRYSDAGDIISRENHNFVTSDSKDRTSNQVYSYDEPNQLHRLIASTGSYKVDSDEIKKYNNTFSYDTIGNMLTKVQNSSNDTGSGMVTDSGTTYTYDFQYNGKQPHAAMSTNQIQLPGVQNFSYDDNGNMITITAVGTGITRILNWDDENRLIQTVDYGNSTAYKYDDKGKRIIKKSASVEAVYVNANYSIKNGDVTSKHIFADNKRVATKMTISNAGEGVYYYHGDHLGSSSVITNDSKSFYEHLEYFPYGETWVQEKASSTQESMPYKFTAQEWDEETKMYYYGARYYDPKLSRWISTDKAFSQYLPERNGNTKLPGMGGIYNPTNLNVYSYALNDPVVLFDPDGNEVLVFTGSAEFTGGPGGRGYMGAAVQWGKGVNFKVYTMSGIGMTAGIRLGASATVSYFPSVKTVNDLMKSNFLSFSVDLGIMSLGFGVSTDGKYNFGFEGGGSKGPGCASFSLPGVGTENPYTESPELTKLLEKALDGNMDSKTIIETMKNMINNNSNNPTNNTSVEDGAGSGDDIDSETKTTSSSTYDSTDSSSTGNDSESSSGYSIDSTDLGDGEDYESDASSEDDSDSEDSDD